MAKYFTVFNTHADYEAYWEGTVYLPNISCCKNEQRPHYTSRYLKFKDPEIELLVCTLWGDYYEITITDNGDDTVDIQKTFISKLGNTINQQETTTYTNVDNIYGLYSEGTTYEAEGISIILCNAVTNFDITKLTDKHYETLTSDYSTTKHIYGVEYNAANKQKADCSVNFLTDTNHTVRIYLYYGYYGYVDGAGSYDYIFTAGNNLIGKFHQLIGTTLWTTFLDDNSVLLNNLNEYVTYTEINGYRPGLYSNCTIRIIV